MSGEVTIRYNSDLIYIVVFYFILLYSYFFSSLCVVERKVENIKITGPTHLKRRDSVGGRYPCNWSGRVGLVFCLSCCKRSMQTILGA